MSLRIELFQNPRCRRYALNRCENVVFGIYVANLTQTVGQLADKQLVGAVTYIIYVVALVLLCILHKDRWFYLCHPLLLISLNLDRCRRLKYPALFNDKNIKLSKRKMYMQVDQIASA